MIKKFAILLVTAITAFTGVAPAQAFPTAQITNIESRSDIQQVRDDRRHIRRHDRHHGRYHNRHHRRHHDRHHSRRHDRHHDRYYRHSRHRHHGNNAAAIIGGLAAGAIIGGAIIGGAVASQSHANSCAARYRSYRASDNTYQPNHGPRRVCR